MAERVNPQMLGCSVPTLLILDFGLFPGAAADAETEHPSLWGGSGGGFLLQFSAQKELFQTR